MILWMAHVRVRNWHTPYLTLTQQIAYTCIRVQNPINMTMVTTTPALTLTNRYTKNESEKIEIIKKTPTMEKKN